FVPPRYRRRRAARASAEVPETSPSYAAQEEAEAAEDAPEGEGSRTPMPAGVNGATAIGPRSRFLDRRKAHSSR
ncbi:undecaprenyl/decaprenyl-phosphate alpha-N-acetylglucosaminyl 1-phosphate transferase, partial [Streptomyces sp. NPDC000188]